MIDPRLILVAISAAAFANGASAQEWQGFYAGFGIGSHIEGGMDLTTQAAPPNVPTHQKFASFDRPGIASLFAGYTVQHGTFVYGAEIAFSDTAASFAFAPSEIDRYTDVKLRLGQVFGRTMVYEVVGYSHAVITPNLGFLDPPAQVALDGLNVGIGIDYRIGPELFAGIEYLVRELEGENAIYLYETGTDGGTLTVRLGARF